MTIFNMENSPIPEQVAEALACNPLLSKAEIHTTIDHKEVILHGNMAKAAQKKLAGEIVKNISGVQTVLNNISIPSKNATISDASITSGIHQVLKANWLVPHNKIDIVTHVGHVVLLGIVRWNFQRVAAVRVASGVPGVRCVTNHIVLKSTLSDEIEKEVIEQNLKQNWSINSQNLLVSVTGNRVHLSGIVPSVCQKQEVERIAWETPGVWNVKNDIVVDY